MTRLRRGFTLTEVMVAGGILTLLTLALFEGITLATKIAHENAELLQAESIAWDAVWLAFNEDYDDLLAKVPENRTATLAEEAAPALARYDTPAELTITTSRVPTTIDGRNVDFVAIAADVEWGPRGKRRALSAIQRSDRRRNETKQQAASPIWVYRSLLSRVEAAR